MWSKSLKEEAESYAAHRELTLEQQLGHGLDGSVWSVRSKQNAMAGWAIKCHCDPLQYQREKDVYERLQSEGVSDIRGFNVPQLLKADDDWLVIEMTVVERPFLLDFAAAHLDARPEFSPEIWEQWEADQEERHGDRWPEVRSILRALAMLGVYLTDIHPGNLAFGDDA
jgi:hypothetical protein